jgi:hypothetical protein
MAEVKVKITAQNEVQTGLQASLAEVRQFAGQAQKEMQSAMQMPTRQPAQERVAPTFKIDIGDYGLEPLRQMQEELKKLRQGSQEAFDPAPAQGFGGSIAGAVGRIAILVGVAGTVGKVIASAFDAASAGVKQAIGIQEQFNSALQDAGRATSLSGAISEFKQLNGLAEQTGKTLEDTFGKTFLSSLASVFTNPKQLLARLGDAATGGAASGEIQRNQSQQRRIALQTLDASFATQINDATDIAGTGGNQEQIDALQLQQQRRNELQDLQSSLRGAGVSEDKVAERVAKFNELALLQDQIRANEERLDTEKEITREKERQQKLESGTREGNVIGKQLGPGSFEGMEELNRERESVRRDAEQAAKEAERTQREADRKKQKADEFNLNTKLLQARALGDESAEESILQRQDLAKGQEATGNFDDAARFAAAAAALRDQQNQTTADAFGASSLQRVGGASTEFFRTGPRDPIEQQKKTNTFLAEILKEFKDKDTLVLKNS